MVSRFSLYPSLYIPAIDRLHNALGLRYAALGPCCLRCTTKRPPLRGFRLFPVALRYKEVTATRLSPRSIRLALQRGRCDAAWDTCEIILFLIRLAKIDL